MPVVLPELRRRGRLPAGGRAANVAGCAVVASCGMLPPVLLATEMPAKHKPLGRNSCRGGGSTLPDLSSQFDQPI